MREDPERNIHVDLDGKTYHLSVEFLGENELLLNIDGRVYDTTVSSNTASYSVCVKGRCYHLEKKTASRILGSINDLQKKRKVKTSMPGKIVKILVKEGESVEEGQAVLILEAMKMQNEIKSPQAGSVIQIGPRTGDSVEAGTLLFTVE